MISGDLGEVEAVVVPVALAERLIPAIEGHLAQISREKRWHDWA
ncbi:MAG TPA: hypothetical protein VFS29_13215 [Motilibacteraceae bacterium]|nr:hypothetical protein [Motilibacteraceae bacterium]